MRDTLYNSLRAVPSLSPAARTDGTVDGAAVSLNLGGQNFRTAMVVVTAGAVTDGEITVSVEESADGSTGWAAVPSTRMLGSLPVLDDTSGGVVREAGVLTDPRKPYLRATAVTATSTTGGVVGAVFLLGTPGQEPVVRS